MKNLKEIILEKLRVDDIIITEKFPTSENLKDIIEFLKEEGFKEYKIDKTGVIGTLNKNENKIFLLSDYGYDRIWFADTSKEEISIKNPIFIVVKDSNNYEYKTASRYEDGVKELNREEFAKLVNKHFSW